MLLQTYMCDIMLICTPKLVSILVHCCEEGIMLIIYIAIK